MLCQRANIIPPLLRIESLPHAGSIYGVPHSTRFEAVSNGIARADCNAKVKIPLVELNRLTAYDYRMVSRVLSGRLYGPGIELSQRGSLISFTLCNLGLLLPALLVFLFLCFRSPLVVDLLVASDFLIFQNPSLVIAAGKSAIAVTIRQVSPVNER